MLLLQCIYVLLCCYDVAPPMYIYIYMYVNCIPILPHRTLMAACLPTRGATARCQPRWCHCAVHAHWGGKVWGGATPKNPHTHTHTHARTHAPTHILHSTCPSPMFPTIPSDPQHPISSMTPEIPSCPHQHLNTHHQANSPLVLAAIHLHSPIWSSLPHL